MAKMDETQLKAILSAEKGLAAGDAYGTADSELSKQRAEAMDYYLADMDEHMPVVIEGRSKAVSTDVADTIDGLMPDLMEIFMGADEAVRFAPVDEEDEDAAAQETDVVNHVFFVDNEGFTVLHSQIKDACLQKNGIVKFWWDEGDQEERETYFDLSDDSFAYIVADQNVEIIEHSERPVEAQMGLQQDTSHDVTIIRKKPYGRVQVAAVPPEEFLIAKDARSINTSRYCAHVVQKTRSQLIDDGYDRAQIEDLPANSEVLSTEQQARSTVNDDDDETDTNVNRAMQMIEVTEHYIRVDWDGDGIAELRKVTTAGSGNDILKKGGKADNEPYDRMPFAGITPILQSHRFWGRSVADIVLEIQKINTALTRHMLDNIYNMNSQNVEVSEEHSTEDTMDDLLTRRPGSPIRVAKPGGIIPLPATSIVPHILPVIEHMHQQREIKTGVARFNSAPNQDLSPYSSTATGANILVTAAQKRIRLIARTFAETGIKDMFLGIHELILKHGKEARKIKLRNRWVTVDPREWRTRKDMSVEVGLGTGTKDQLFGYLERILGYQVKALEMQGGPAGPLVQIKNVHHTLKRLVETAGFRNTEAFFAEPDENVQPQPQRPDPKAMEVQGKLELQKAKQEGELELKREGKVADLALKRQEAVIDAQIEMFKAAAQSERDKFAAQIKAQTEASIAQMKAQLETYVALARPDVPVRSGGKVG